MGFRRQAKPVIPGELCPAERTNKVHDPAVTITQSGPIVNRGVRTCGRCGRGGVEVVQSLDTQGSRHRSPTYAPMTAWYYEPHRAPDREVGGDDRG